MEQEFLRNWQITGFAVVLWLYVLKQFQAFRICSENPLLQRYRGFRSILLCYGF